MPVPALLFFAAVTIRPDHAELRAGCSADESVVATLPAGTAVEVRFAIADGSNCYKIAASVEGKSVIGYVPGSALSGIESFDQERAAASDPGAIRTMSPVETLSKLAVQAGDTELNRAAQLLKSNQPQQALQILEPIAKRHSNNPDVLLLAGLAAYRSDQLREALDYCKQSLELRPNPTLAQFCATVEREGAGDRSGEKLYGTRVLLRYEGEKLPADVARTAVVMVDSEFTRISAQLGCPAEERLVVIVQSRDAYLKSTGAAEWSGGLYNGRIRISLADGQSIGSLMRRELAHEIVHACLTNIPSGASPWPAWLQEGMAQKFSGDVLPQEARAELRRLAEGHQIPKLESLAQNWSRLNAGNARIAYSLALAAVDQLFESYANYGIRNVLNNPERLPQITAELDKKLGF